MRPVAVAVLLLSLVRPLPPPIPSPRHAASTTRDSTRRPSGRLARRRRFPRRADAARVVLGRIQLERYRQSSDPKDLAAARGSLRDVDAAPLDAARARRADRSASPRRSISRSSSARRRSSSSRCVERSALLGPVGARARARLVGDGARSAGADAAAAERPAIYARILARMTEEMRRDPGSAAAGYWLAAAARAGGDLDRAWHAASPAGCGRRSPDDRGAALRADLDRLVTQAIIPERAAKLPARRREGGSGGHGGRVGSLQEDGIWSQVS